MWKRNAPYIHGPCDAKKAWEKLAEAVSAEAKGNYIKYSRLLHAVQRYGFREKHIDRNGRYWGSACEYFKEFSEAVVAEITEYGSTALHVAVMLGRVDFVKELLELMTPEQLEIKTRQGNALSVAAGGNNLEIVKMLAKIWYTIFTPSHQRNCT
ncbi:uncharacterized protein LOC113336733 [Papaver somniferum]|uniref:uncharacterized protein LOC113336733 n=1 Tax=Papaver somniferum TaxID=3469 RepID=UPI000E704EF4|nr:uncharacterized protein LOC113336733 [Papaver somniferum]